MDKVVYREEYIREKIDTYRQEMQSLIEKAYALIDEAIESKYDFFKIGRAGIMLDHAVSIGKEIKRLELKLAA